MEYGRDVVEIVQDQDGQKPALAWFYPVDRQDKGVAGLVGCGKGYPAYPKIL